MILSKDKRAELMEHLDTTMVDDAPAGESNAAAPPQDEPSHQAAPEESDPPAADPASSQEPSSGAELSPLERIQKAHEDALAQWEREKAEWEREKSEWSRSQPEPEPEPDLLDRFIRGVDIDDDDALREVATRLHKMEQTRESERRQQALVREVNEVLSDYDDVTPDDLYDAIVARPTTPTRELARQLSIKNSTAALAMRQKIAAEFGIQLDDNGRRMDVVDTRPAAAPRAKGSSSTPRASSEPKRKFNSVREATKALHAAIKDGSFTI